MSVHRTLAGGWAECPAPEDCPLLFHLPELSIAEAEALPLRAILPLLNAVQPPTTVQEEDGTQLWLDPAGLLHRDYDLPARVSSLGSLEWYQHGDGHREYDRPAYIGFRGHTEWWYRNDTHRDGGKPAVIGENGYLEWWVNGEMTHRQD